MCIENSTFRENLVVQQGDIKAFECVGVQALDGQKGPHRRLDLDRQQSSK
jgi:hypothetical protein